MGMAHVCTKFYIPKGSHRLTCVDPDCDKTFREPNRNIPKLKGKQNQNDKKE